MAVAVLGHIYIVLSVIVLSVFGDDCWIEHGIQVVRPSIFSERGGWERSYRCRVYLGLCLGLFGLGLFGYIGLGFRTLTQPNIGWLRLCPLYILFGFVSHLVLDSLWNISGKIGVCN
jgi:hypothetical protein